MKRKYLYEVLIKDAMSDKKRKVTIEATSMLNAILSTSDFKNIHEYVLKIEMKS